MNREKKKLDNNSFLKNFCPETIRPKECLKLYDGLYITPFYIEKVLNGKKGDFSGYE